MRNVSKIAAAMLGVLIAPSLTCAQDHADAPTREAPDWFAPLQAKLADSDIADVLIEVAIPPASMPPARERDGTPQSAERIAEDERARIDARVAPLADALRAGGVDIRQVYAYQPLIHALLTRDDLRALAARDDIVAVHDNFRFELPAPSRDTDREQKPAAAPTREAPQLTTSTIAINAPTPWSRGYRGQGTAIAVVDTGLNGKHEMFRGKVAAEACFSNPSPYSIYQSFCPEKKPSAEGPGTATLCPDMKLYKETVCDHGSHVAGIALGNSPGRQGVAPLAQVVPIQVFTGRELCGYCLGAYTSDLVAAVDWLIKNAPKYNIVAVNMSLGGSSYADYCAGDAMDRGIRTLRAMGVLTAIAAGNEAYVGRVAHPGCIKDALTVGSTNNIGVHSYYSNAAPMVDVVAPGERITSATGLNATSTDSYSGTSMATPHVAGAVAVLRSRRPQATVEEIEYAVKASGPRLRVAGWTWSTPRLDLARAVDVVGTTPPPAGVPMAGFFPGARPGARSILRLANPSHRDLTATLTLVQDAPRRVLGRYAAGVPGRSTQQISVADIETALGQRADAASLMTVYVDVPARAFAQHVTIDTGGRAMSNLTVCASERADARTYLPYVQVSASDSPSYLIFMNDSAVRAPATFEVYNAATGAELGIAVTPAIEANATAVMSARAIAATAALGGIPGLVAVNLNMYGDFAGVVGHAVAQNHLGTLTDMTVKCAL
jgi:subtilisin family serine protease